MANPEDDGLKRKNIDYKAGDFEGRGYLVLPKNASAEKPVPGVIVVHGWWGQDDYARKRADMLAELGYAAFAVDMYGGGRVTDKPDEAGQMMVRSIIEVHITKARFEYGMHAFQAQPEVDSTKIAAIGHDVGGRIALQMAVCNLPDLHAVAAFHSGVKLEIPKGTELIKAKILVCHAQDDFRIPEEILTQFKADMKALNADLNFEVFPGTKAGFTDPRSPVFAQKQGIDVAYNKEADDKSWAMLKDLLVSVFAPKVEVE